MTTWADHLYNYYTTLRPPTKLVNDIEWLYPQRDPVVLSILKVFFQKFYNDSQQRQLILGINPGRFGAGITGINFTAPRQLSEECGINHPFGPQSELSAEFIYTVVNAYGGTEKFYQHFFLGSVCPLGFIQHGKNLNYYDDKELLKTIEPFIIENLSKLISYHVDRSNCICIGGEKNFRYLTALNERFHWFDSIVPVPHPRFIMQYKRKFLADYVDVYLEVLKK